MIDRGQYSKSDSLAETVATATSILAYVEPALVLPFVVNRFHLALETESSMWHTFVSNLNTFFSI